MTTLRTENILKELPLLDAQELDLVYEAILKQVSRIHRAQSALSQFKGLGKRIWQQDAQTYISEMRGEERV